MIHLAVASLVALALAGEVGQDVRLAVVAGNNRGLDSEEPLEFAEVDARRVHALLIELGGILPSRARLVLGGGPDQLLRAIEAMTDQARTLHAEGPVALILYVSAHGDEGGLHLGGKRLELARVLEALHRVPAHLQIVVTDTCRASVMAQSKGGRPVAQEPVILDESARVDGEVQLAATGPGELAQEWNHLGGSLFTHHLLAGLRGAADADGDGRITLAEVYTFAFRATSTRAAESGRMAQRPAFDLRLAGFGDWVFTRIGAAGAELRLLEDLEGRIRIAERRGRGVMEVDKRLGEPLRLALAPGLYRVSRVWGEWAEATDVNLVFGGRREVGSADLVRVKADRALTKGGPPIVLRPWRLVAAWGLSSPSGAGLPPEQAVELGVERVGRSMSARLLLGASGFQAETDRVSLSQREARLSVSLAWSFPVSVVVLGCGVESRARLVRQELGRSDEVERLYGSIQPLTALALAFGPALSVSVPPGDRTTLGLEVGLLVEWAPDQGGSVQTRTIAQARLTGGWTF